MSEEKANLKTTKKSEFQKIGITTYFYLGVAQLSWGMVSNMQCQSRSDETNIVLSRVPLTLQKL